MNKVRIAMLVGLTAATAAAIASGASEARAAHHPSCASVRPQKSKVFKQNDKIVVWSRHNRELRERDYWACARSVGKRVFVGADYSSEDSHGTVEILRLNTVSVVVRGTQHIECQEIVTTDKYNLRTRRAKRLERTSTDECG